MARARPRLATALVVALLGLVGTPPTTVFLGKLTTATAAWDGDYAWLATVVFVNSLLSLFLLFALDHPGIPRAESHRRFRDWRLVHRHRDGRGGTKPRARHCSRTVLGRARSSADAVTDSTPPRGPMSVHSEVLERKRIGSRPPGDRVPSDLLCKYTGARCCGAGLAGEGNRVCMLGMLRFWRRP